MNCGGSGFLERLILRSLVSDWLIPDLSLNPAFFYEETIYR